MSAPEITTSNTLTKPELTEIAERIRMRIRRTAEDIIAIGQDLTQVKGQLGHGKFLEWINSDLDMSERLAQNFMAVATWAEDKSAKIADLPPSTLYLLAAPSTPKEVAEEVVAEAMTGEPPKTREVKRRIKEAKNAAGGGGAEVSIETALAEFGEPATSREHGLAKVHKYEATAYRIAADGYRAGSPRGHPCRTHTA